MTIEQLFEKFAEEYEMEYRYGFAPDNKTKTALFLMETETETFETMCFFIEEQETLMVIANINIEYHDELYKNINALNATIKFGNFFYDDENEQVYFKNAQFIRGENEEIRYELFRDVVLMSSIIVDEGSVELY